MASSPNRSVDGSAPRSSSTNFIALWWSANACRVTASPASSINRWDVEVAFLSRCVRVEFVGERKERFATVVGRNLGVCHATRERPLHGVAGSQVIKDRHDLAVYVASILADPASTTCAGSACCVCTTMTAPIPV